MSLKWFALGVAFCTGACTAEVTGTGAPNAPSAGPKLSMSFGETDEELAANANEMMSKAPANPNPTTLTGLYERTAYGSEDRPESYLIIQNHSKVRVEVGPDAIAVAVLCEVEVGGAIDDKKTLQAYGTSPIEVYPWGIRILKAVTVEDEWADYGVKCGLQLPDEDWPYCADDKIPEGYSTCVYMRSGVLSSKGIDGGYREVGKKIR